MKQTGPKRESLEKEEEQTTTTLRKRKRKKRKRKRKKGARPLLSMFTFSHLPINIIFGFSGKISPNSFINLHCSCAILLLLAAHFASISPSGDGQAALISGALAARLNEGQKVVFGSSEIDWSQLDLNEVPSDKLCRSYRFANEKPNYLWVAIDQLISGCFSPNVTPVNEYSLTPFLPLSRSLAQNSIKRLERNAFGCVADKLTILWVH